MRARRHEKPRLAALVSLVAFGHLAFASAAHAQSVAPPPPPAAPAAAAPYDPSAAPQLQQPMMPPTGPVVRLSSDNPVARLQMMQLKWRDVCTTPCGVAVDPNGTFRIGGGTIRPSEEFRMPRPAGTVLVKTQIGSIVKHWVGFGMILSGAATVLGGLLLYSEGSSLQTDPNTGNLVKNTDHAVGITYIVIGAIVAAIGIPLAMSSTSVEVR
jgi:hypothetical protein